MEQALFRGELMAVAATNALELGVDIGSLDITLHLGFPGQHRPCILPCLLAAVTIVSSSACLSVSSTHGEVDSWRNTQCAHEACREHWRMCRICGVAVAAGGQGRTAGAGLHVHLHRL